MKHNLLLTVLTVLSIMLLSACSSDSNVEKDESDNKQDESEAENNQANENEDSENEEEEDEWYNRKGNTKQDRVRYDIAQMIIDEIGLETNIPAEIIPEDKLDTLGRGEMVKDGSLLRFYWGFDSIDINLDEIDEGGEGTMFIDLALNIDLAETYDETNLLLLKNTQEIVDYLYQEVLPESEMEDLSLTLEWQYPDKHGAEGDYRFNNEVIEMNEDYYEAFWEDKETDDFEARLIDFEDADLSEGGARPGIIGDTIIPLTDNLERHDVLGEYIDLNGIEVKVENIRTTDSMDGEKSGEGEYEDTSQFIKYDVSIKNNRDYELRIRIPSVLEIPTSSDDGASWEKVVVDQEEGLLPAGEEHSFTAVSNYEDDVDHVGLKIRSSTIDAYDAEKELLDEVPVATWSIEDEIE